MYVHRRDSRQRREGLYRDRQTDRQTDERRACFSQECVCVGLLEVKGPLPLSSAGKNYDGRIETGVGKKRVPFVFLHVQTSRRECQPSGRASDERERERERGGEITKPIRNEQTARLVWGTHRGLVLSGEPKERNEPNQDRLDEE